MSIRWAAFDIERDLTPYSGRRMILAVPHSVRNTRQLDPDEPYSFHLARWDSKRGAWLTNETDDETGGPYYLPRDAPALWSEVNLFKKHDEIG